jgi:hypothetical protein
MVCYRRDSMKVPSVFTEPVRQSPPVVRYGCLFLLLGTLIFDILRHFLLSPAYHPDHYANTVVLLFVLLTHLAVQFRWPVAITIALRILAIMLFLFGMPYAYLVYVTMLRGG